jgi:FO synthase
MAGSEFGSARTVAQLREIAARAGRPARQRTTTYALLDPAAVSRV